MKYATNFNIVIFITFVHEIILTGIIKFMIIIESEKIKVKSKKLQTMWAVIYFVIYSVPV